MKTLFIISLLSWNTYADHANKLKACDEALNTCMTLTTQQQTYITALKRDEADLETKAVSEEKETSSWTWILLGFIFGGLTYAGIESLHGR